jgi:hypothetical protein
VEALSTKPDYLLTAELIRRRRSIFGEPENRDRVLSVRASASVHRLARLLPLAVLVAIASGQQDQNAELQQRLAAHAKAFDLYDSFFRQPLTTRQPDRNGVVTFTADFLVDHMAYPSPPGSDPARQELDRMLVHSPTVVQATATERRCAFTPSKAFIYSDWDFRVERVFRDQGPESAQLGSTITVSRPGGSLIQNGITYIAEDKTFPDFQPGSSYVLLLWPWPESHSYTLASGFAFQITSTGILRIEDYHRHLPLSAGLKGLSPDQFFSVLDTAVKRAKGQ